MAEYAVVLCVIPLAIVTSYALLSGAIQSLFQLVVNVFSEMTSARGVGRRHPPPHKRRGNPMTRRAHTHDENGQTMVEFAMVLPILLVVLLGSSSSASPSRITSR